MAVASSTSARPRSAVARAGSWLPLAISTPPSVCPTASGRGSSDGRVGRVSFIDDNASLQGDRVASERAYLRPEPVGRGPPSCTRAIAGLRSSKGDDLATALGAPVIRGDLRFDAGHPAVETEGAPVLVQPRTSDNPSGGCASHAGCADPDQPKVRDALKADGLADPRPRSPIRNGPDGLDKRRRRRGRARGRGLQGRSADEDGRRNP
jgi:hypothetical protein